MSQIRELVDDRKSTERDREQAVGGDGEVRVPWQACTLEGRQLTVHYFTNATNEFLRVDLVEKADAVRVAVLERRVSHRLPGQHRSQAVALSAPLAERLIIYETITASGRRAARSPSRAIPRCCSSDERAGWSQGLTARSIASRARGAPRTNPGLGEELGSDVGGSLRRLRTSSALVLRDTLTGSGLASARAGDWLVATPGRGWPLARVLQTMSRAQRKPTLPVELPGVSPMRALVR